MARTARARQCLPSQPNLVSIHLPNLLNVLTDKQAGTSAPRSWPQDPFRPSHLLALPPEIREMIWKEYFYYVGSSDKLDLLGYMRPSPIYRSLMQVCKQFQIEALGVLIKKHTVVNVYRKHRIFFLDRLSRAFRERVRHLSLEASGPGHIHHEMSTLSINFTRLRRLEVSEMRTTADSSLLVLILADATYRICHQNHVGGKGLREVNYQRLRWTSRAFYIDRRMILRAFRSAELRARAWPSMFPDSLQIVTVVFTVRERILEELYKQTFSRSYSWYNLNVADDDDENLPTWSYRHILNAPVIWV